MTEESTIYKGKIIGFASSFKTGMATLFIKRDDGEGHVIMCESAPTVKALQKTFGNVVSRDNTIKKNGGHINKKIYYCLNAVGILSCFVPASSAPSELADAYKIQKSNNGKKFHNN